MTRRRTLIAAFLLLALAFITLDFRETGGPVGTLQRGADTLFNPIQDGFATVVRPIGSFFGTIFEIGTLRDQIAALRAENDALRENRVSLADLERQNQELRDLLNMADRQQVTVVGARVIARPPGDFDRSVLIDSGAAQGIAVGMAVINDRGVVGLVTEVSATRARVELASSNEGNLVVRVAETSAQGLLTGQGAGPLRLELITSGVAVPLGAEIVTQAFVGSLVPGGLPVGRLVDPPDGTTEGERFLEVRPFVDFGSLSTVGVVISGQSDDDEIDEDERIETDILPAPQITREPNPDAPAEPRPLPTPGIDFPIPPGTVTATPTPTPTGGDGG